jgi:hypothetical protein
LRSCRLFLGEEVEFWIIIGRELVNISARLDFSLAVLFTRLCRDARTAQYIPATVSCSKCEFYQLKNPVSMVKDRLQQDDVFLDRVKQACLEERNKTSINASTTMVDQLANKLSYNYVYLVINIPDRKHRQSSE